MAVSMKDLDPAFQGVGNKDGTEIWRIDKSRPVVIPKSTYDKLSSGHSYVILQTCALRSGIFHHDIHYWIGKYAGQDEAAAAAVKAVELDASLGGRAVQYREAEGHETDKFLSYFKTCFIPIAEGAPSNINKEDEGKHRIRLFMCSGRHVVRVKEVPFTRASLSHDDVFVLDTESKIFQFNGANTDIYHQAKALDAVLYLKENYHKKDCHVAVIEDGKFVADADSGEFWGLFGGFAPLGRRLDSDYGNENEATAPILFCVFEGQVKKVEESILKRELLNTNNCYIVDCGTEMFAWVGRDTQIEERRATTLVLEKLIETRKNQHRIHITCTIEGFEPREFKSKFESWPISTAVPISENGRGKVAVLLKHKGFNVKGLLKAVPAIEQTSLFNNAGKLQVWCVNGSSKESLPVSKHGKLFNNNCYIVLYTYPGDRKDDYIIYSWLGHQSTMETRASTAQSVKETASSLERAVEVHIFEGKEPPHFTSLFQNLFVIKGDDIEMGVRLFQVQQSGSHYWQAIEVDLDATSLNSSGCMFLQMENSFITWYGKFSTIEEQEAAENLAHYFKPNASSMALKEGSESELFWDILGGKKVHPSHREPKDSAKDPHLFSCSIAKGQLKVTEVFSFTQDSLLSDEVMVLDCHSDVFVWVGQTANAKLKLKAVELGQIYLEQAAKYEGISLETPLYKIMEGSEPSFFKYFFGWDSSKTTHLNVFQRKLLSLRGQSAEVTRSMRRSPTVLDSKTEVLSTTDKSRFGRNLTFKPERSPEKSRAPKSKFGNGRSPGRSVAVSALSSMFEFQLGAGEVIVASSTIPKLSTLRTRRETPSATPTSSVTPSPRTPRPVASPRSPAIAALASVFEPYSDKKLDFAWPGLKSKSEEKASRDFEAHMPSSTTIELKTTEKTATKLVEASREVKNGDAAFYPYERVKVSSPDPVIGIDSSRRETYLSNQDFQDTFHMDKDTFYKLPKWKQDKYKILADLF